VSGLAPLYRHVSLGDVAVAKSGTATSFDFGNWDSEVASRRNDDGTMSMVTISPGGFEFVAAGAAGKRTLTMRDAQHDYVFDEAVEKATPSR